MANYPISSNPIYDEEIRMLQDDDPASASDTFNPLFQKLIDNTHAIKKSGLPSPIKTVTENTTLDISHSACLVAVNSASAVTITVPAGAAFPIGTEIEIFRQGAGTVTIAFAGGVTVWCASTDRAIADQYASICLKQLDTDIWVLQGSLG